MLRRIVLDKYCITIEILNCDFTNALKVVNALVMRGRLHLFDRVRNSGASRRIVMQHLLSDGLKVEPTYADDVVYASCSA